VNPVVRQPAVAGRFYPADARVLAAEVDRYLADAGLRPPDAPAPRAVVVPHAGYVYSAPVAATAYRRLVGVRGIRRVVLLGPNHTVPLRGMAVSAADLWRTPFGDVPVDAHAREVAAALPGVTVDERPHLREHALEVQLPFLQRVLPEPFALLPVVVGETPAGLVADLLDAVWDDATLVVVSTDLSHYHDHDTATALDRDTVAAVAAGTLAGLTADRACGFHPLRGLLEATRRHHLDVALLDRRTSGDTAGDRSAVVGYASFVVSVPSPTHAATAGAAG
jgi:AmmeMemoRadiSam system protein B